MPARRTPAARPLTIAAAAGAVALGAAGAVTATAADGPSRDATVRSAGESLTLTQNLGLERDSGAALAGLEKRLKHASVATVMRSANRRARPIDRGSLDPVPQDYVSGFRFDEGDSDTSKWYPQGITGSGDATASGRVGGRKALLTSWYAKDGSSTQAPGVRVSFNSAERLRTSKYRHVLLVVPYSEKNGYANFDWVDSHAGGIAWVGRWLYVAETGVGLRVFDTKRMMEVRTGDKGAIGCNDRDGCQAADYRYVMPQVAKYEQPSGQGLRFSSVSVDRSGPSPRLVTSEFKKNEPGGRIVRWDVDAKTGRLAVDGTTARSSGAWITSAADLQGALLRGSRLFLSTSYSTDRHRLYRGKLGSGRLRGRTWPTGGEDLTYAPSTKRLYTVTERPGQRAVVGVKVG